MRGAHLLPLLGSPWALKPDTFDLMTHVISRWMRGEAAPPEVMERVQADSQNRAIRKNQTAAYGQGGSVRIIGIYGILSDKANVVDAMSGPGSTSTQMISAALKDAMADDSVGSIVLDVDSPGGSVFGIEELGNEIYRASAKKPILACADHTAASASFWLATQATHFYASPSAEVGSVGVMCLHQDFSEANRMEGYRPTYIAVPEFKTELNPDAPPTQEGLDYQLGRVNSYYSAFTKQVARGRKTSVSDVRENYGRGRVVGATDAVAAGMACGVKTLDETIVEARTAAKGPRPHLERWPPRPS